MSEKISEEIPVSTETLKNNCLNKFSAIRDMDGDEKAEEYLRIQLNGFARRINAPQSDDDYFGKNTTKESLQELYNKLSDFLNNYKKNEE